MLIHSVPGTYVKVEFSPDGLFVAAARNNVIDLFDTTSGALVRTFSGLIGTVYTFAFSPTGSVIAAGDNSFNSLPAIRFWRISDGSTVRIFDQEVGTGILGIDFSSDGQTFAYTRADTSVVMASNPFAAIAIFPNTFMVSPGIVLAGALSDLLLSDDNRLTMRPGVVLSSTTPPIRLIVEGTSPFTPIGELKFTAETRANVINIQQSIELYDFAAAQYVLFDTRAVQTSDSSAQINATNPSRFLETGTRRVRARISWKAQGPVLTYPWNVGVDQTIWTVTP